MNVNSTVACLADRSGCHDADRSAGSDSCTTGVRHGGVWTRDVICVPRPTSKGIQELSVVCQPSFGSGLLRAELGGTKGAERISQRR